MLRKELESSTFNKKELFDLNKSSTTNSTTINIQNKDEYSLSTILFDPTNSSPKDKFINTIRLRMDKYYSLQD